MRRGASSARGRWRLARGNGRGDAGQTVTEYLMILGILTAIIIALTKMIAPAIADGMLRYMERRVVYNSTVADGGVDMAQGVAQHQV
jgi:hypothetical protein